MSPGYGEQAVIKHIKEILSLWQVRHMGIPLYLSGHAQHHVSLYPGQTRWPPYSLVRHNALISDSLDRRRWHALQVGQTWPQKVIPTLSLTDDNIIIGVGGKLLVHPLVRPPGAWPSGSQGVRAAGRGREYPIVGKQAGSEADIMGVGVLDDGQLAVAQYSGVLRRYRLGANGAAPTAYWAHPKGSNLHAYSTSINQILTVTSLGLVSLYKARSPWLEPSTLQLAPGSRAWSALLTLNNRYLSPTALVGVSGGILLHDVSTTGLSRSSRPSLLGPDHPMTSSPYDLKLAPSPSVHHPSTVLSAWYDSDLRVHDLRSSSRLPVIELSDKWANGTAMYSCAFVGETYVAGGGARHGTVSFFDIRNPKHGWSCFSPGGKGSPVYALQGEGGRVWGVTERRAFVLAFDGTGSTSQGLVLDEARALPERTEWRPDGYRQRGGKWQWGVRHNDGERRPGAGSAVDTTARGYDHRGMGLRLFDPLPVV